MSSNKISDAISDIYQNFFQLPQELSQRLWVWTIFIQRKKINNSLWTWMLYCQILFFHLVQPPYNCKLWKSWLKGTEIPVYWCTGLRAAVSAGGIFGTYGSLGFEMSCLKIMSGDLRITHQKSTFKGNSPGIRKFLSRNSIIKLFWTLPEI